MILDQFKLPDRVALVTGASTGLGAAIAIALAEAGAHVACHGNTRSPESTCNQITSAGGLAHAISGDLSQPETPQRLVVQTLERFGRIDILINNAGTIKRADAVDFTEADWDAVMDVNRKSVFFLNQAFAKHALADTARKHNAKIMQIASLLSFQGGIRVPSYTAAKSGLAGVTKLMANEWASKGINVNAIAPGYFVTNNTEALRKDETRSRDILARIPAGRWGEPSDLGGAAVFLASPASDYVHGAIIPVDGGWLAR